MLIRLEDGTEMNPVSIFAAVELIGGIRRDVITLTFNNSLKYTKASKTFIDGLKWSVINAVTCEETGETQEMTYDKSDYCIAGPITDNRDGSLTVKMCKITTEERLRQELQAAQDLIQQQQKLIASYEITSNSTETE